MVKFIALLSVCSAVVYGMKRDISEKINPTHFLQNVRPVIKQSLNNNEMIRKERHFTK